MKAAEEIAQRYAAGEKEAARKELKAGEDLRTAAAAVLREAARKELKGGFICFNDPAPDVGRSS